MERLGLDGVWGSEERWVLKGREGKDRDKGIRLL